MQNLDIRQRAENAGVRLWQIADKLQINDGNFSRRLRKELPQPEKEKIFGIIQELEETRVLPKER